MADLHLEQYIETIGEGEVINFPSKKASKPTGPDWAAYDRNVAGKYGIKSKAAPKPTRKSSMEKFGGPQRKVEPKTVSWDEFRHGTKNEETELFSDAELAYLESKLSEFDNK